MHFTIKSAENQGNALHIINSAGIVYHPQLVAVYHQAAGEYTLMRDEMQPEGLMIYTTLRAVMIYQACGLVKKREASVKLLFFGAL